MSFERKKEKGVVTEPVVAEMGWMEILSNLKQLSDSNTIKVQARNLGKIWKPLISDLERMVKQIQAKHIQLMDSDIPGQQETQDPVKKFLAVTDTMVARAERLLDSTTYDLYIVSDEKAARAIEADNAVILYKNPEGTYCARVVAKKSHTINKNMDVTITRIPDKLIKQLKVLEKNEKNEKNEVIITEKNIDIVDQLTKELAKKAGIDTPSKSPKDILSGALQLAKDLPVFLDAFAKLPIVPMVASQLDQFKTEAKAFNFSAMLKAVLPIDVYKEQRKRAFDALQPDKFKALTRDKQAAALALMESYNMAIKSVVLAMDKIEIENGLVAGALSDKVAIIDNKSIKELCEEFNLVYVEAMRTAGFTIQAELYPYHFSILEQRRDMLAVLPIASDENREKVAKKKQRLKQRIDELGTVPELPKRENPQDFYKFMQKTLSENYQRLQELKRQLAPQVEEENPAETKSAKKPLDLTAEAKAIISKAENELKEILDKTIFELYFAKETPLADNPPWVQQLAHSFHKIKTIIEKLELIQAQDPELLEEKESPLLHLEQKVTIGNELAAAGAELLLALNQLQGNVHLRKLISLQLDEGMVLASNLKRQATSRQVAVKAVADAVKQSTTPLTRVMQELKKIIKEKAKSAELPLRDEAVSAVDQVAGLVQRLELLQQGLEKEAKEQPNLVLFAIRHFSEIISCIDALPLILSTLKKLSKKDAADINEQINAALKQMVLLADKLEIQFCLKEGYLTNRLQPMMMAYYKNLNELGYDFVAGERYPFPDAIAVQRAQLLEDTGTLEIQKQLIANRMQKADEPKKKEEHKAEPEDMKKAKIINAIKQHIFHIRGLGKKDNAVKIRLLDKFKEIATQTMDIDQMLQKLRQQKDYSKDIHLLYEGNTGVILKQLEFMNASPADLFHAVDIELAQLKKQRGTVHYFRSIDKAKLLDERVNACEKLQLLLKNHNLSDALDKLEPQERSLLEKYDHEFLNKLNLINTAIAVEYRPKTMLGAAEAKNDSVIAFEVDIESDEQKHAKELIDRRLAELESAIFQTSTKQAKIAVLTALREELKPGVSVQAAISRVKAGEQAKNVHLLFEGRTGKALRAAVNVTMTSIDLRHRIDAEIYRLKHQRYSHLYVFAQSRKSAVDGQIEALQKLRKEMDQPGASVVQSVEKLLPAHKMVLLQYEADLMKDIGVFEKAVVRKRGNK